MTAIFYLARGPLIVFAVTVSILLPYIREYIQDYCTPSALLHLSFASIGLVLIYHDASTLAESAMRSGLNLLLDKIVLDDVMRLIYDPTDGLWACCVGTYLGASSMYGLQMDEGQRTELVQSSLGLRDERQARTVLMEPGGCKELFPTDVQNWLESSPPQNGRQHKEKSVRTAVSPPNVIASSSSSYSSVHQSTDIGGFGSDKSASDCDTVDIDSRGIHETPEETSSESNEPDSCSSPGTFNGCDNERTERSSSEPQAARERRGGSTEFLNQADPLVVFFRILKKMAQTKVQTYAKALPRSKIETIGTAAAVAYGLQLALRRRPSSKKANLLGYLCASIATISFGTILSREAVLGNIYNRQTLQMVCKDVGASILSQIKQKSASSKKLFAMLVLVLFCRRKRVAKESFAQHNVPER